MVHKCDSSVNCHQCDNGAVGLEVLDTLRTASSQIVVLLDINMPVLNGWEFLDGLQKINLDTFTEFGIYLITSSTDRSDKLKAQLYPVIKKLYHKPLSKQDIGEMLDFDEKN